MERGFFPDDALAFGRSLGRFYFLPDLKVIDYWGLTDATVARTPVTTRQSRTLQLAHDRQPSPEYLKQRAVNIRGIPPRLPALTVALTVADYAVKVGPDLWMPFNTDQQAVGHRPFRRSRPENVRDTTGAFDSQL